MLFVDRWLMNIHFLDFQFHFMCLNLLCQKQMSDANYLNYPFCCSFWLKGLLVFVTTDCNVFHLK